MFILICFSLFIRIVLQLVGQIWITTTAHTTTLVMLPIITYIITKVISGNIALSLGMVGALSIVRFRNPVRSPLELTVYFCAITMGIAAGVSLKWLVFLGIAIILALIILISINIFSKSFFKKFFFTTSFSEGNSLSSLEIKSSKEINWLDSNSFLILKKKVNNDFFYTLTANNFEDLKKIENEISKNETVVNYQLNK
tara:strand:- start:889 stop:1482 length:594 start_codon:yes stop_codon:yes gene_type:complete